MKHSVTVACPHCDEEFDVDVDLGPNPLPPPERYYTLAELQRSLGLSRDTLKRLCQQGELVATKLGKQKGGAPWRVAEKDLNDFLLKRSKQGMESMEKIPRWKPSVD